MRRDANAGKYRADGLIVRSLGNFVGTFYYAQPYVNTQILFKCRTSLAVLKNLLMQTVYHMSASQRKKD